MKTRVLVLFIIGLYASVVAGKRGNGKAQHNPMFENTPSDNVRAGAKIDVHVVPHSHDDVGWLKTVDQYYYGANYSIDPDAAGVQYIIDNVVTELRSDPAKKFIYVEMAFFSRWWNEQTSDMRHVVRTLVANKQLEFINAGWTMHDEATTYYEDMIDQMTLGHRFVVETFGTEYLPKIAWQIDPFGHSSTSAMIDIGIGFEALFFARMDYQDYNNRVPTRSLEMRWNPSASLPTQSLLTGMMYNSYGNPRGFMFEYGDEPIMDDPNLEGYNIDQKAEQLLQSIRFQSNLLRHNQVMLSWGEDFMYGNAHIMFKNIQKLINYINANSDKYNVTMFYSTPSIYAEAIEAAKVVFPSKSDDFFPYADHPHAYWTGYFTSRPTLKGYVRWSNNLLQAAAQVYSSTGINDASSRNELFLAQEPVAVATHHDAVSGTEQQHVANDYAKRLYIGNVHAQNVLSKGLSSQLGGSTAPSLEYCPLLNQSICPATSALTAGKTVVVVVYNPLASARTEYVTLPIPTSTVSVVDGSAGAVASQVVKTADGLSITFAATVPPMGFSTYFVQPTSSSETEFSSIVPSDDTITLQNKYLSVKLNGQGNFVSITNLATNTSVQVQQQYLYYTSSTGTPQDGQASGAYIFRPKDNTTQAYESIVPTVLVLNGSIVSGVDRVFGPSLSQKIRLYENSQFVEVVDIVGPIDVSDGIGKEVISRYTTDLATDDTFYTDSNGIELITRKINYRPSWPYQVVESIAGNYYPINAMASIKDSSKNAQFTMLTDRSRGGGSMSSGALEGMIHRATTHDDARGVAEPINEKNVVASTTRLVVSSVGGASSLYRTEAKNLAHPFVLSFSTADSAKSWISTYKATFSPIATNLPTNVQLLTFSPTNKPSEYILRFHHIFQAGEDATLAKPINFNIGNLFAAYTITEATETQLTASKPSTRTDAILYSHQRGPAALLNITLQPTEIRTFVVQLAKRA